jgi:hypothetical protein
MSRDIEGSDPRQNLRHLKRLIGVDLGQGATSTRNNVYQFGLSNITQS